MQVFCLYCDKIFLTCIWESVRFPEKLSSTTPLDSCHYIIWFRVLPKWKYYFMPKTYLKPSQTSMMKLLTKVGNTSRDVFRTVFSIQNVFRTSKMKLFTKIMIDWKPLIFSAKSSILDILLSPKNASAFTVFNDFHQKLHLRYLRGQIWLCMYLVLPIWRWIIEFSIVCYKESQKKCSFWE